MLRELKLLESGMGMTEGNIARWHKNEGDAISQGEVLVDVETAKAIEEIQSPIDGVLEKIVVPAGATAEVNATIALLRPKV